MPTHRRLAAVLDRRRGGIFSPDRRGRGEDARPGCRSIRSRWSIPAIAAQSWPARQDHRRRAAGRVRQRHRRGPLRERGAAADGVVQRRSFPAPERIDYRIGINVGEIVIGDDGDIFGDGVNIAARLEALADAGGICVSARVQEDVAGRLDLVFEDMGEQTLKNIARPVRLYRVLPDAQRHGHEIAPANEPIRRWRCRTSRRSRSWRSPT